MRVARRGVRKLVLLTHVTSSVGWSGAVLAFVPLAAAAVGATGGDLARGAYLAADLLVRFVIVPLALAAVLTGVLSSLVSTWGLVRHYWVIAKLVLTVAATVVLLMQIEPIGAAAVRAGAPGGPLPEAAGLSMLVHAIGGLVVLLAVTALAVYKPRGTTRFATGSAARR
ncbi:DUF2269 domain-containing protein [Pseudonocardia lacus]|uniref:DUF2269 domain-containing protein n=1 Tax=Pseudonocardia lacus TaxID=2835865 RepID=UPI001BDD7482|nr:DUF2269 domain-containing protein [Pseudonocardia lacus]